MKEINTNLLNKEQYVKNFIDELSKRRILNKTKKDIYNMSIKRPIPIDNYDYYMFNFIPKIHKELFIKELNKINRRYLYKYLIGKIISKIFWDDYIYFLIEDKNKDIISVSIYHFENNLYPLSIDNLEKNFLSIGKYILFINPLFIHENFDKILCLTTYEFIMFDNFEEIKYFIIINNEEINPINFKIIGDFLITKNSYEKAIYYYEKAIKKIEKSKKDEYYQLLLILLYKISFAYYNYRYFSKVLFYCNYALKIIQNPNNYKNNDIDELKLKFFTMKIKGLISLRKYKEGFYFYEEYKNDNSIINYLNAVNDNNKQLVKEIISKKENQNGIYDFKEMLYEEEKNFYLNYGDYINSKVEIIYDNQKGLKLVCKRNNFIKKGELVLVEKALVFKKNEENFEKKSILGLNAYNEYDKKEEPYQNLEMTNELMEKIKKYKEDYEIFFILYDGENKNLNNEQRKKKYLNGEEKRMGFEKVKKVIDSNKYSALRSILFENKKGFGLWGYTSILNHSCNPNINNFSIGDFMICFAIKDIYEGEELNTLYINNSTYFTLRQEKCLNNWGFICSCEVCNYDKKNINIEQKKFFELMFQELYKIGDNVLSHKELDKKFILFEKFLIENKYKLNSFDFVNGYLQLIYHYGVLNNFNKCKELSEIISDITYKNNYYIFELENLNIIFCFFGFKDTDIFNYLLKKYKMFAKNYIPLNEKEFNELIELTLKY